MLVKRSELYEKAWSMPMTKLAAELGISDVGLAKACRRHAVPVPPRGYWVKLRAGQAPAKITLPTPELDHVVHLATNDPEERARQQVLEQHRTELLKKQAASVASRPPVPFAENLEGAHPLIRATQRYAERLPVLIDRYKRRGMNAWRDTKPEDRPPREQHGRYDLFARDLLNINASLDSIEWILRFHATVLRALAEGGASIARREGTQDRSHQRTVEPAVLMQFKGEVLAFRFTEGYRRVRVDAAELARRKKDHGWASEYETRPSGNFTFSVEGTEYQTRKAWQGTQEKLQKLVDEIVRTMFALAAQQPQLRKERDAREANAQRAAELRAQEQRRRDARAEQLKKAFLMMEADARVHQLKGFLERLEQRAGSLPPPLDMRANVWVSVVREELAGRNPAEEILHESLTVPSLSSWPPAWWPDEEVDAESGPNMPT